MKSIKKATRSDFATSRELFSIERGGALTGASNISSLSPSLFAPSSLSTMRPRSSIAHSGLRILDWP
jgi:hypothetical protein